MPKDIVIDFNPTITQTSPSNREFRVIGLNVGHNNAHYVTGIDRALIRFLDGAKELAYLNCHNNVFKSIEKIN